MRAWFNVEPSRLHLKKIDYLLQKQPMPTTGRHHHIFAASTSTGHYKATDLLEHFYKQKHLGSAAEFQLNQRRFSGVQRFKGQASPGVSKGDLCE